MSLEDAWAEIQRVFCNLLHESMDRTIEEYRENHPSTKDKPKTNLNKEANALLNANKKFPTRLDYKGSLDSNLSEIESRVNLNAYYQIMESRFVMNNLLRSNRYSRIPC